MEYLLQEALPYWPLIFIPVLTLVLHFVEWIRRVRREREELQQDVALLILEKAELEEDTTHLIVENYELRQNMAAVRERNMADASEENNQLFHDVALLTLENQQLHETSQRQAEELHILRQTIPTQLGEQRSPVVQDNVPQLRRRMSALEEDSIAWQIHRTSHIRPRAQGNNLCPMS